MKASATKSILALAVAAVMYGALATAAAGANGSGYLAPDDRPGLHGPMGIDTRSVSTFESVAPDDRAGLHGPSGIDTARRGAAVDYLAPDDRPGIHGPSGIAATAGGDVAPSQTYVVAVDSFDWTSAGIGAAAAAGAILAAIGAVLLLRSSRLRAQVT